MVPGINTRCDVGCIYEVVNIKTTPILTNVPNSLKVTLVFQLVTSRFPNARFAYTNKSNECTHLLFLMFRKNLQVPVTLSFNGAVFTGEKPLSDFKTAIDTRLTAPVHPEAGLGDVGLGDVGLGDVGLGDVGLGDVGLGDVGLGDTRGIGDVINKQHLTFALNL